MKIILRLCIPCLMAIVLLIFLETEFTTDSSSPTLINVESQDVLANVNENRVEYINLGVPQINSSFKTYMDYRAITNKNSNQYKFIQKHAWSDYEGFMRCNRDKDFGIDNDYYLIAMGSYYGTTIGTKYRITTDTGNVFYGVLADCKSDRHTNQTNQYGSNKDIVEFLVDTKKLNKSVKYHGSANVYMPLNGRILKIEQIKFINE